MLDLCDIWRIENPNIKMLLDLLSVPHNSGLPRFLLRSPGPSDFFSNPYTLLILGNNFLYNFQNHHKSKTKFYIASSNV